MCIKTIALSFLIASTHHVDGVYNETHNGLGLEVPVSCNAQVVGGVYENSYYRRTVYAGASYEVPIDDWVRVGAVATAVTGYEGMPAMAAVTARFGTDRLGVRVMHVPTTVTAVQMRMGF